jgi:hypothetical protein
MTFERIVVSASRGLSYDEARQLSAHTNLATAQRDYSEQQGPLIEQFDAQRSAARGIVVAAIQATAAARLQAGSIPGSRFRNVKVAVVLEGLLTERFLLPAYVLAYRYDGQAYRVVIHGQDVRCVCGVVPRSPWKILLVVVGVVALVIGGALALMLVAVLLASV